MAESSLNDHLDSFDRFLALLPLSTRGFAYKGKKVIWENSFEELKNFVKDEWQLFGTWSSPGGSQKKFKSSIGCSEFVITYYTNKRSIQFQGELGIKTKELLTELLSEGTHDKTTYVAEEDEEGKEEAALGRDSLPDFEPAFNESAKGTITEPVEAELSLESLRTDLLNLKNAMEENVVSTEAKFSMIMTDMVTLARSSSGLLNEDKGELEKIRNENASLRERVGDLTRDLSDLKQKLKIVHEERDSLVTAVRLLHGDMNPINQRDCKHWQTVATSGKEHRETNWEMEITANHGVETNNKFEILSDSQNENNFIQVSDKKRRSKKRKGMSNPTHNANGLEHVPKENTVAPQNNGKEKQPSERKSPIGQKQSSLHSSNGPSPTTTVIIGDSMIKNVHGWNLGKLVGHRVVVKSFPGATTSEMTHYLKPTLDKHPQQIVLHVGTNDLGKRQPHEIADNIADLAIEIESNSNVQVLVSELVARSDETANEAVKAVNQRLRKYCNQRDWQLVRHDNITTTDLNKGGLHLNEKGTGKMSTNFVNKLVNDH